MRRVTTLVLLSLLVLSVQAVWANGEGEATEQSPAEFYEGKTITIIEGFGAGSDFDMQARMIAPFLKELTGARIINVDNRGGAAGLIARNYLYQQVKNDGLTIMLDHGPRLVQNGLFETEGVNYQWKEFVWIGKLLEENILAVADKNLSWDNPKDPAEADSFIIGVSRPFYESLIVESLGWNGAKLVPGYQNPNERTIAIARGEIQAAVGNTFSFTTSWDIVKPLVITFAHDDYEGVPTVREVASPDKEKWVNYLEDFQKIQYSFIAPPGTPDDRVAFLEDCLRKIYNDPDFQKKLDVMGMDKPSSFIGAEELRASTMRLADLSPEEIEELRFVLQEKYVVK